MTEERARTFDDRASAEQLAHTIDTALRALPDHQHTQALAAVNEFLNDAGPGNHVGRVRAIILESSNT